MVNQQVLTLPIIGHVEKKTPKLAKWYNRQTYEKYKTRRWYCNITTAVRAQEQEVNIKILIHRRPPTESIPYIPTQKYLPAGASPGEKVDDLFLYYTLNQITDFCYWCNKANLPPVSYPYCIFMSFHQHKAAFTMRVLYNPDHPKHRDLMHQNYGLQLPDLYKNPGSNVSLISRIFSYTWYEP